jgi:hypothetical protein
MVFAMSEVIVKEHVIRDTIHELIEKLKNYIVDIEKVRAVCQDQHGIGMIDSIDFENGDIVNYNGQIVFKLDLKICCDLSIFIDRKGHYISTLPESIVQASTPEERNKEAEFSEHTKK